MDLDIDSEVCPVCNVFLDMSSVEKIDHVNQCLDDSVLNVEFICPICGISLHVNSSAAREYHVASCLEEKTKDDDDFEVDVGCVKSKGKILGKSKNIDKVEKDCDASKILNRFRPDSSVLFAKSLVCFICETNISSSKPLGRLKHFLGCAKKVKMNKFLLTMQLGLIFTGPNSATENINIAREYIKVLETPVGNWKNSFQFQNSQFSNPKFLWNLGVGADESNFR